MEKFIDNNNSTDESEKTFVIKVTCFSIFFSSLLTLFFFFGMSTLCQMSVSLLCTEIHKLALLRKILTSVADMNKAFVYEAFGEEIKQSCFSLSL